MKQKTEIEFELSETIVYSRRNERFETLCPRCQASVEMSTPQIAAALKHTNEREISRLLETGELHFVETDRVLACHNTLLNMQKEEEG